MATKQSVKDDIKSNPYTIEDFERIRREVLDEAHKRPFMTVNTPCKITHLVYLNDQNSDAGATHLQKLCVQAGKISETNIEADDSCQFCHFPTFTLRWERHTEFSTYTLISAQSDAEGFSSESALSAVPQEWLEQIPGQRLTAFHILMCPSIDGMPHKPTLETLFFGKQVYGGPMMTARARVWTSFRSNQDSSFNHFVIETLELDAVRAGRLLQNVLELETYRLLALLTFPLARRLTPEVRQIDLKLMQLTDGLTDTNEDSTAKPLLEKLLTLASSIENMRVRSNYRFNASRAYASLVRKRLQVLREDRPESQTSLAEFLDRRFSPAIATCNAVESQLQGLSRRIARAGDLLRTRIDLGIQHQNQKLLASMDRRASLQLQLQQTVEGLSIFAISYYLMGLIAYAIKPWQPGKWITAALVPVVVASVWFIIRGIRKQIHTKEPDN